MAALADTLRKGDIVLPLPRSANRFWQGYWEVLACSKSTLLRAFSKRVLKFYNIPKALKSPKDPLVWTFINRTTMRKLIEQDQSLSLLREKYADVRVDVVDYSMLSFAANFNITGKTDILVGAHGAGLTHRMFLLRSSALAEFMPVDFQQKDF